MDDAPANCNTLRSGGQAVCTPSFHVRPATEEEEAWLQMEDGIPLLCPSSPVSFCDAEDCIIEEAEFVCKIEEEKEEELVQLANSKDVQGFLMMKALMNGSTYLVDASALGEADFQTLISVQQASKMLLQLVEEYIFRKLEEERFKLLDQYQKVVSLQKQTEAAAAKEQALLKDEITKLKRDYRALHESFEREKDRSTCRICFVRPRDVLPLPCMHFDYCDSCLRQYQRMRNICPTCRSPISGVLRHNLSHG
ncbi:hypothetical protein KP509_37G070700 [Ceratopteris richardii]|uniref:RING-type domain-containing protein n=1 Tax=Ceratopteris richardii TaxID=49495 RepID=A0A8T2Q938_CERRI|nr:hypothetical protein KP509_37G070700 [Ceratopteris richardii]KAH7280503.1 hypothetical protein KP509_37G070700 [Ceratopteris richardii]